MEIKVRQGSITEIECDVIIVNLFEGFKSTAGSTGTVDEALGGIISKYAIEQDDFKGKLGETYIIPTYGKIPAHKVLLVGSGKPEDFSLNKVREVASKAIRKSIAVLKAKKVCTVLHGVGTASLDPFDSAQMITEGTLLGAYKFSKYKSKKEDAPNAEIESFEIVEIDSSIIESIDKGIKMGRIIAESTNFARDLVNEPAEVATPMMLAETAMALEGIQTTVMQEDEIRNFGMGAFLAVARGSSQPPRFIHMVYKPKNAVKKIAIIGKGVTFDSGGLDIKPSASMLNMKDDMSGAAAVISIMKALPELNLEVEVHGIIASCENMPGGKAFKPGDVLKAMNGKTIEVDNTDAEGRLTLADALCFAESLKPDQIVDMATLTGACMVALGYLASGIMGNNQELVNSLIKSADTAGERFWQLPMYEEYFEGLKSDIADFKNSGSRWAGASSAGLFLKEFVKDIPWAHIDIAGPAMLDKEIKELSKGPSGAGVRALINYLLTVK